MKTLLSILLLAASTASADMLFYLKPTGRIVSHDKQIDAKQENGVWLDIPQIQNPSTNTIGLATTTNDLNTTPPVTNISQIVIVPISPEDHETDFSAKFDKLLKAFALVTLDEINLLRVKAGLAPRTIEQLKSAVRTKYQELP